MVAYTRNEIISATELARNVSGTLHSIAQKGQEKIAISKNNKLEAVLIDIEEYERLKEAHDLLEHIQIAQTLEARNTTPRDQYMSLEASAQALGIDIDAL